MKKVVLIVMFLQSLHATQGTNLHRYMLANYYQYGNDLQKAGQWYSQITPDSDSHYVYLGYLPFLAANQSYQQIVNLIPELDERFKGNQELQMIIALALEKVGQKNDAYSRMVNLNEQNKGNQEIAFKVIQLYLERAEPENALKVIDNVINSTARRPNNFIFYFLKAQIYLQLNKKPEALLAVKQCIETYPRFDKSWLLYAVLQEQEGKLEEAIKGYTTFLETSQENNSEVERHLLSLAFRQKVTSKKSGADPDSKECLNQALNWYEKKDYAKALTHINQCLALNGADAQARLMKIQILISGQNLEAAAQQLVEWIVKDSNPEPWLKTLHLLTYIGLPYSQALRYLNTVEKQKGATAPLALYQADLALRDNNHKEALPALHKALNLVKDETLRAQIGLQLSIIYYDQQKWQLAQKTLEQTRNGHTYPPADNLLAYLYATKTKDLTKAQVLISQALAQDPHNPHFLDTQALIYYKKDNYDAALAILQKVAAQCPTDFTILNHLGKCYFKQGKTSLAMQTMKSAQTIAKSDKEKTKSKMLLAKWQVKA